MPPYPSEGPDINGYGAGAGKSQGLGDVISRIRGQLEKLSNDQVQLAEAREKLLIDRESLISSGKSVRSQRVRTGDAEVTFMDVLRIFFNKTGNSWPPELTAAYEKVMEERDKLGVLEEDYIQAERDLGGSEWTFNDMENDFYQYDLQQTFSDEFFDSLTINDPRVIQPPARSDPQFDPVPPSTAFQYHAAMVEHDRLMKCFNSLRLDQAEVLEWSTSRDVNNSDLSKGNERQDFTDNMKDYFDLLTKITNCEVRIQHLKSNLTNYEGPDTMKMRRLSEPNITGSRKPIPTEALSTAYSDGAVSKISDDVSVKHRIRDWLLDCLKKSAVQRNEYLSILRHNLEDFGPSDHIYACWEDLATQYWPFDTSEHVLQNNTIDHSETHGTSRHIDPSQVESGMEQQDHDDLYIDPEMPKIKLDFEANFNYKPVFPISDVHKSIDIPPRIELSQVIEPSAHRSLRPTWYVDIPEDGQISPLSRSPVVSRTGSLKSSTRSRNPLEHIPGTNRQPIGDCPGLPNRRKVDSPHESEVEDSCMSTRPNFTGYGASVRLPVNSSFPNTARQPPLIPTGPENGLLDTNISIGNDPQPKDFADGQTAQWKIPQVLETNTVDGRISRSLRSERPKSLPPYALDPSQLPDSKQQPTERIGRQVTLDKLKIPSPSPHRRSSSASDITRYTASSCGRQDSFTYSPNPMRPSITSQYPRSPPSY